MMGGGKDLDDAFRWLCKKGNGGDFLILRAIGDNEYNSYVNGICKMNSVADWSFPIPMRPTIPRLERSFAMPKLFLLRGETRPAM